MKKIILFCPLILFIVDRIIKYFAPSINIEGGFLSFGFYKNYAGAFSLPIAGWLYNVAGIILLVIFIYLFYLSLRARSEMEGVAISSTTGLLRRFTPRNDADSITYLFIILGGLSNLFDRLAYGYTIDYVNFLDFSFFNLADVMLLSGIFILLFFQFKKRYEK